jgi:hypothetical protein
VYTYTCARCNPARLERRLSYDFKYLRGVRSGGITLAHVYQSGHREQVVQGSVATVGEVTRRFSSLISAQRHSCRTNQEEADNACPSVQAFNISTLDVPPGASHISPEAATPHARLNLTKGGALTTAPGTDQPLVFTAERRAAERWGTRRAVLLKRQIANIDAAVSLL